MAHIKTAISLDPVLFEKARLLSQHLRISRSQLFAQALEDFLRHHENRQLLARINRAHSDMPDRTEQTRLKHLRRKYRQRLQAEEQW